MPSPRPWPNRPDPNELVQHFIERGLKRSVIRGEYREIPLSKRQSRLLVASYRFESAGHGRQSIQGVIPGTGSLWWYRTVTVGEKRPGGVLCVSR